MSGYQQGRALHIDQHLSNMATNRSKQGTEWARAVRRLGVLVGMGGKANCLCLRGIWETPKPRYREETKPVADVNVLKSAAVAR
jgi:hypothetical protein